MDRALQDGEQEAEGVNLGSVTISHSSRIQFNSESTVALLRAGGCGEYSRFRKFI